MGRIKIDLSVANYGDILLAERGALAPNQIRQVLMKGIVDSGSTQLILPESVVQQLGLKKLSEVSVRYGDHSRQLRPLVGGVFVQIQGRGAAFQAVSEPNRDDALIGAIVLEALDFLADCGRQRIVPRDPEHIIAEVG